MTKVRRTLSVTEAASLGVSKLVRSGEAGQELVIPRQGRLSSRRLARLEADLRDSALVMARMATDNGAHTGLDDITAASV